MNIFLDLDGTLTNPRKGILLCIGYALEKLGMASRDPDSLDWVVGPPLLDSFAKLGVAEPEQALAFYRERYSAVGLFENVVYDGIPEMLTELKLTNSKLYLATAKPELFARQITAHFGLSKYFSDEFGPKMDGTRNNKGALLEFALKQTGADAETSVMVGDRIHDFEAAKQVGMKSVAVRWGFGNPEEYASADAMCSRPKKLAEVIQRVFVS